MVSGDEAFADEGGGEDNREGGDGVGGGSSTALVTSFQLDPVVGVGDTGEGVVGHRETDLS